MSEPPIVLFARDSGWKVGRGDDLLDVPASAGSNPDSVASAVAAVLGTDASAVTLVIPASWCLSATVPLSGLPARNRRTALLYRLELLLPLTAEDIAADYLFDEPRSALAICVSTATVRAYVESLEAAGVVVHSIMPAAIYAVQSLVAEHKADDWDVVIWQSDQSVELFGLHGRQIVSWYAISADADELGLYLGQMLLGRESPPKVMVRNLTVTLPASLKVVTLADGTVEQAVMSGIRTGVPQTVDLRRDGLAPADVFRSIRRPLIEIAVAAAMLVICICGAAFWRASRLERLADSYRDQQSTLFSDTFPGHVVPANIVSRLRSEERGLRANQAGERNSANQQSAMLTLQSLLTGIANLPSDARLQVQDLHVADSRFSVDAMVRNRTDLNALTDILRQLPQMQVDLPQTDEIAGQGLHITLNGMLSIEDPRK